MRRALLHYLSLKYASLVKPLSAFDGLGPVVSQGAEGIAQFMPRTAHGLADPFRSKRCAIRRVICAN
jgi:hypothetical protein